MVGDIVRAAFRESNLIGEMAYPSPLQAREALRALNDVIAAVYGNAVGENLQDWVLDVSDTCRDITHPCGNARLVIPQGSLPLTVYLPQCPQDGQRISVSDPFGQLAYGDLTLDGNGRAIEGSNVRDINQAGRYEWMYRADLGDWVALSRLTFADDMPFPDEFDAMFKIALAMRINPTYGRNLDPQSQAVMTQSRRDFINRYLQSAPLDRDDSLSWPFMSKQSYGFGRAFSSTSAFGRGDVRGN